MWPTKTIRLSAVTKAIRPTKEKTPTARLLSLYPAKKNTIRSCAIITKKNHTSRGLAAYYLLSFENKTPLMPRQKCVMMLHNGNIATIEQVSS